MTGQARKHAAQGRIEFIDSLRLVAILGVLVVHLRSPWAPGGYLGVYLFFAISGFLISEQIDRLHRQPGALARFLIRRCFRILPMLWVSLALISLCVLYGAPGRNIMPADDWWRILPGHALLYENRQPARFSYAIGVLWTLHAEMWFYLAFSVLACIGGRAVYVLSALALLLRWTLGPEITSLRGPHSVAYFITYLDCFAAGIVARFLASNITLAGGARAIAAMLAIGLTVGVLGLYLLNPRAEGWDSTARSLVAVLGGCIIVLYLSAGLGWRQPIIEYFGRLSYSMYLLHGIVLDSRLWLELRSVLADWGLYSTMGWSMRLEMPHIASLFAVILLISSILFHHTVEKPGIALGRKIASLVSGQGRSGRG
jgi:peptidoglycan/LPS O-acetylase OafA/YrhL